MRPDHTMHTNLPDTSHNVGSTGSDFPLQGVCVWRWEEPNGPYLPPARMRVPNPITGVAQQLFTLTLSFLHFLENINVRNFLETVEKEKNFRNGQKSYPLRVWGIKPYPYYPLRVAPGAAPRGSGWVRPVGRRGDWSVKANLVEPFQHNF